MVSPSLLAHKWAQIQDFPDYEVSDHGVIYNTRRDMPMKLSVTQQGHLKCSLVNRYGRYTLSVAVLVASAFVEVPNPVCDSVIVLNGDYSDLRASNLAWRPKHFQWKYAVQLKRPQGLYITNCAVVNLTTRVEYPSIRDAGMTEGLLFEDVWRSTHAQDPVWPTNSVFRLLDT